MNNNRIENISLDRLENHPKNIRKDYGNLKELAASIVEHGIQNPLLVVPSPENDGKYWVVAGNRRLLAGRKSGLSEAPCIVTNMDGQEQAETMLIENLHRKNLSVPEEAAAFQMCLDDFGMDVKTLSQKTGFSRSTIRRRVNVAKLDRDILEKRAADPDIQLSFTILAQLEKVRDVGTRNRILEAASDEKDIACKVEQAVAEQDRARNLGKLKSMAKTLGICDAPKDAYENPYSGRWQILKAFDSRHVAPETLLTEHEAEIHGNTGLYFMVWYGKFRIIKDLEVDAGTEPGPEPQELEGPGEATGHIPPDGTNTDGTNGHDGEDADDSDGGDADGTDGTKTEETLSPAVPEEPSPEEIYRRKISGNVLLMKDLAAAMMDEMHDFYIGMTDGRYDAPEDMDALLEAAWDMLLHIEPDVNVHAIASGIIGRSAYDLDGSELEELS